MAKIPPYVVTKLDKGIAIAFGLSCGVHSSSEEILAYNAIYLSNVNRPYSFFIKYLGDSI
ncbi:hypothetical protein GCM10023206_11880 [Acinetobacter puyangensis]